MANPKRICLVPDCGKPYHAHGYCSRHAGRFRLHGDPIGGRRGAGRGEPLQWIKDHAAYEGDDCIRWPFEIAKYGYGTVKHEGKKRVASRVMCEEAHGPAPSPKHEAAHSCGNGHLACMNRRHIRWATKLENVHDAMAHGTNVRGEKVHCAKLTEEDVRRIRSIGRSMKQKEIATIFGVRDNTISRILSGKRWGWCNDGNKRSVIRRTS